MVDNITGLDELYKRCLPALLVKVRELNNIGVKVSPIKIWSLLTKKWKQSHNLLLCDIVSDIMSIDKYDMEDL